MLQWWQHQVFNGISLIGQSHQNFLSDGAIFSDPNIFIADAGTIINSSPYDVRMINTKEASKSDNITGVSGNSIVSSKMGDLPDVICDKWKRSSRLRGDEGRD